MQHLHRTFQASGLPPPRVVIEPPTLAELERAIDVVEDALAGLHHLCFNHVHSAPG